MTTIFGSMCHWDLERPCRPQGQLDVRNGTRPLRRPSHVLAARQGTGRIIVDQRNDLHSRPARDFDHWRQLGNPGWSSTDVLRSFKRSESQERGGDAWHGGDGRRYMGQRRREPRQGGREREGLGAAGAREGPHQVEVRRGVGLHRRTHVGDQREWTRSFDPLCQRRSRSGSNPARPEAAIDDRSAIEAPRRPALSCDCAGPAIGAPPAPATGRAAPAGRRRTRRTGCPPCPSGTRQQLGQEAGLLGTLLRRRRRPRQRVPRKAALLRACSPRPGTETSAPRLRRRTDGRPRRRACGSPPRSLSRKAAREHPVERGEVGVAADQRHPQLPVQLLKLVGGSAPSAAHRSARPWWVRRPRLVAACRRTQQPARPGRRRAAARPGSHPSRLREHHVAVVDGLDDRPERGDHGVATPARWRRARTGRPPS